MHRHSSPLATCVHRVACAVSVARMLAGEGASSTVYNVTRGYDVNTIIYVLPSVHAEQGSAPQARAGSISMRDVRKVKIASPPGKSITQGKPNCDKSTLYDKSTLHKLTIKVHRTIKVQGRNKRNSYIHD